MLVVCFSPDGSILASGSGDKTVRLWDLSTQTPLATGVGHTHWVLCLGWAPDGTAVASGAHDATVRVWEIDAKQDGHDARVILRGHKNWVTALSWQPLHRAGKGGCRRLVSSSKDSTAKIWDTRTGQCLTTLSGHAASVTSVKWGGEGLIYTGSQDRTIIVWAVDEQNNFAVKVARQLKDHAHWVNSISLSTEHLCRTGPFDHTTDGKSFTPEEAYLAACKKYRDVQGNKKEMLVSCSDDFSMILWSPTDSNKPVKRMLGHQQLVNRFIILISIIYLFIYLFFYYYYYCNFCLHQLNFFFFSLSVYLFFLLFFSFSLFLSLVLYFLLTEIILRAQALTSLCVCGLALGSLFSPFAAMWVLSTMLCSVRILECC